MIKDGLGVLRRLGAALEEEEAAPPPTSSTTATIMISFFLPPLAGASALAGSAVLVAIGFSSGAVRCVATGVERVDHRHHAAECKRAR